MRGKILSWGEFVGGLGTRPVYGAGKETSGSVAVTALHARRLVGRKECHYHLEYPNGGNDPTNLVPWDPQTGGCDCIGFAAWCAGFDRYQPKKFPLYDGYINTDSMVEEAMRFGKWFTLQKEPAVGDFIVAESFWKGIRPFRRRIIGHIGVMEDVSEWATKGLDGIQVIHCSYHNPERPGNVNKSAIWKTSAAVWKMYPKAWFVRFNRDYALSVVPK